jgi:hypothetical protein
MAVVRLVMNFPGGAIGVMFAARVRFEVEGLQYLPVANKLELR